MVDVMSKRKGATDMAALPQLTRESLARIWKQQFRSDPPRGCGRQLLELAAAYSIQEKSCGGLSPAARRALDSGRGSADVPPGRRRSATGAEVFRVRRALKLGTRLLREWNGQTHYVEVVEGGFLWNARTYRSLSVIAREITGVQWSGPRFFGV